MARTFTHTTDEWNDRWAYMKKYGFEGISEDMFEEPVVHRACGIVVVDMATHLLFCPCPQAMPQQRVPDEEISEEFENCEMYGCADDEEAEE